jgi:hypothetical protein
MAKSDKLDELDEYCVCGHDMWDHAKLIGLGCDKCSECEGWETQCVCDSKHLLAFGCRCQAKAS